MAAVLAFRVLAGLVAAALTAVLLEYYGLAGQTSPLPLARVPGRPHPAPGAEAGNIFWALQVTLGEPGEGGEGRLGAELAGLGETLAFSAGAEMCPSFRPQTLGRGRGWGWGSVLPWRGWVLCCTASLLFPTPIESRWVALYVLPLPDSDICLIPAFGRYPTFT